ncbi:restriction endonuclease [Paenibacillus ottowii]
MAKTYYAEGRQVAYVLRGLFVIGGLAIYFNISGLHWGYLFGILLGSVILGEIFGTMWTRKRRQKKKAEKTSGSRNTGRSRITSTNSGVRKANAKTTSKKLTDAQILQADIEILSGTDFERLMELYYIDQGYSVQRVGGSGDHEVDLILKGKEGYKIAVQCKRWKRDVGNDIVLRLKAGKQVHGCYDAWIVTTSNFTKAAKEAADRLNIKLINGVALTDRLKRWEK